MRSPYRLSLALLVITACTDRPPTFPPINAGPGGNGDPTVTAADPDTAAQDTTLDVLITGSSFDEGSRAQWAVAGVPSTKIVTNSTRFLTPKKIVANITIAADADTVLYDIIVTTSTGKKGIGTELFKVRAKGRLQPPADPVIAFLNYSRKADDKLLVMNADGSNQTVIHSAPHILRPSWSPGGASIVFRRDSETAAELWIVDVGIADGTPQGTSARPLTDQCGRSFSTPFIGCEPAWSPGNPEIAFTEGQNLWLISVNGGTPQLLYVGTGGLESPTWSPDGQRIAVVEGLTTITILALTSDPSGSAEWKFETRLVFEDQFQLIYDQDWARTGPDVLAFSALPKSRAPGEGKVVYTVSISSGPMPLRITEGDSPTWSPDDMKLAFIQGTREKLISLDLTTGAASTLAVGVLDPDWARKP